jgi:hypothetical protein
MVMIPDLAMPAFDATVNVTKSSPVTLAPEFIVTQLSVEEAVTGQLAGMATATDPVPPAAANVCGEAGENCGVLHEPATCVTVNAAEPAFTVADRLERLISFDPAVMVTVPGPTALDGGFTVIQLLPEVTSHAQPDGATTETVTAPPFSGNPTDPGENDKGHVTADPKSNFITNPVFASGLDDPFAD